MEKSGTANIFPHHLTFEYEYNEIFTHFIFFKSKHLFNSVFYSVTFMLKLRVSCYLLLTVFFRCVYKEP